MRLKPQQSAFLRDLGLLFLRLGAGTMMIVGHGYPKLGKLSEDPIMFADPIGIGVTASLILALSAEFFGSIAVMLGVLTRAAAVPLLITMLVAALIFHGDDPFGRKELPLAYALMFTTLIFTGPGRFSLDAKLFKR